MLPNTDPLISPFCLPKHDIVDNDPARVGLWMQQHGGMVWRTGSTCIGLERQGQLVAGTMYDFFNGASIFAHIVITGPVTRQWLHRIFHYPFVQLGVQVLIGQIASDNYRSQRLVERMGFTLHTVIPGADPAGATLLYTMSPAHCRFIGSRYGKIITSSGS